MIEARRSQGHQYCVMISRLYINGTDEDLGLIPKCNGVHGFQEMLEEAYLSGEILHQSFHR